MLNLNSQTSAFAQQRLSILNGSDDVIGGEVLRRFQRGLSDSIQATLKRATTYLMVYHLLQARDNNFKANKNALNSVLRTDRAYYLGTNQEQRPSILMLTGGNTGEEGSHAVEVVSNLPHEISEASDETSEASTDEWTDIRQISSGSTKRSVPYESRDSGKFKRKQKLDSELSGLPKGTRRNVLTAYQKGILEKWIKSHFDNPYPSKKEKIELSAETGISERQVT